MPGKVKNLGRKKSKLSLKWLFGDSILIELDLKHGFFSWLEEKGPKGFD